MIACLALRDSELGVDKPLAVVGSVDLELLDAREPGQFGFTEVVEAASISKSVGGSPMMALKRASPSSLMSQQGDTTINRFIRSSPKLEYFPINLMHSLHGGDIARIPGG